MNDLDKMALLPCPFCGNPDVQLVTLQDADGDALHAVGCPKCGCNGTPHVAAMDDPRPAAVAAWNRRALLTAPQQPQAIDLKQFREAVTYFRDAYTASSLGPDSWQSAKAAEADRLLALIDEQPTKGEVK